MLKALARVPPHIKVRVTKSLIFAIAVIAIVLFMVPLLYGKVGTVMVQVSSTPSNVDSFYVTIEEVQIRPNFTNSNWQTIVRGPVVVNLQDLSYPELIGMKRMVVSDYTEVRLWVSQANMTIDNKTVNLIVPSARMRLEKTFDVFPNQNTTITINMPISDIVVQTGNTFMFVPTGVSVDIEYSDN